MDEDVERLVDLAWESIGELPFDVRAVARRGSEVFFNVEHITDGCFWFRIPAVAARLSDVTVLRMMDEQIEHILDVIWEWDEEH